MTKDDFKKLPYLVLEHQVVAVGYCRSAVAKFVDCGVLTQVKPAGAGLARYQKKQLAQLLQWEELLEPKEFAKERPLMDAKAVQRWTGWGEESLVKLVKAGGLKLVKPPGCGRGKFLKTEIGRLIGFEQYV